MNIRQRLADLASTVEGVTVTPYFKATIRPGSGMVRMDRVDYPDRFGGLVTWQVAIALPQDIAAAEKWIEDKLDALVEALGGELIVRSATPQQLVLDTGTVPAVVIEGQREKE